MHCLSVCVRACVRNRDLNEGKHLCTLEAIDTINALVFSPNRYWLCAAAGPKIKIWDLESKAEVRGRKNERKCVCVCACEREGLD